MKYVVVEVLVVRLVVDVLKIQVKLFIKIKINKIYVVVVLVVVVVVVEVEVVDLKIPFKVFSSTKISQNLRC